jgi:hypothetical protein
MSALAQSSGFITQWYRQYDLPTPFTGVLAVIPSRLCISCCSNALSSRA